MLIDGTTESEFLINLWKVFERLREHNVAANPRKTKLGLVQVEYVGYLISAEGTSLEEKRLKILNSPLSKTKKAQAAFDKSKMQCILTITIKMQCRGTAFSK